MSIAPRVVAVQMARLGYAQIEGHWILVGKERALAAPEPDTLAIERADFGGLFNADGSARVNFKDCWGELTRMHDGRWKHGVWFWFTS